jgi:hypothetical protein
MVVRVGDAEDDTYETISLTSLTALSICLTMTSTPFTELQDWMLGILVLGTGLVSAPLRHTHSRTARAHTLVTYACACPGFHRSCCFVPVATRLFTELLPQIQMI